MNRDKPIAWLAGFFEGEGSITLSKSGTPRGDGRYVAGNVKISVSNTVPELLEPFSLIYGSSVKTVRRSRHRGLSYSWVCPSVSKVKMLTDLLPYLVSVKRHKFEVALRYLPRLREVHTSGRSPLGEVEVNRRLLIYREFYKYRDNKEVTYDRSIRST